MVRAGQIPVETINRFTLYQARLFSSEKDELGKSRISLREYITRRNRGEFENL